MAKKKTGRPSTYDPKYCEQIIELGKEGKSLVQISAAIDIPRTTMQSWGDQHPEFSAALTRAKEFEQSWWEDKGQTGLDSKSFNSPLWVANVKSRFRGDYGDKLDLNHGVQDSLSDLMKDVDGKTRGLPRDS